MFVRRVFFLVVGLLSLVLGLLGILLPVLPTVPFVLLAGFCFARSSERLHAWLHQHPWFADGLKNWHEKKALRQGVKRRAMLISSLSFAVSIYLVPLLWIKIFLVVCFTLLMLFLWRLPVVSD